MPPAPYQFADALEPELKRLYLQIVESARGNIPMQELARALASRDVDAAVKIIESAASRINPILAQKWTAAITQIFGATAAQTAASVGSVFGFTFNAYEPLVIEAIQDMVGARITPQPRDVMDTRWLVSDIVDRGWKQGITAYNQARMIRPLVGTTRQHQNAALRFLQSMLAPGSEVPIDTAYHNYNLYVNRLVNWRAETISRTENIMAANAGRHAAWRQMVRDGILEADRMWLEWNVTDDDRLCPVCAPMDGQRVKFDPRRPPSPGAQYWPEYPMFVSSQRGYEDGRAAPRYDTIRPDPYGAQRDMEGRFIAKGALKDLPEEKWLYAALPPIHPNCRCNVRLVFE